jgi:hypothetical protein
MSDCIVCGDGYRKHHKIEECTCECHEVRS